MDCLWPTAEELALPPSFTVHDDPTCAGATFLLEDFDFFGASTAPTDEDFARLLLLGGGEAASDARAKPAGHSSATRSDSGAKAATPPRRRTVSPPSTPEKLSKAKAAQVRERRLRPGAAGRQSPAVAPLHASPARVRAHASPPRRAEVGAPLLDRG